MFGMWHSRINRPLTNAALTLPRTRLQPIFFCNHRCNQRPGPCLVGRQHLGVAGGAFLGPEEKVRCTRGDHPAISRLVVFETAQVIADKFVEMHSTNKPRFITKIVVLDVIFATPIERSKLLRSADLLALMGKDIGRKPGRSVRPSSNQAPSAASRALASEIVASHSATTSARLASSPTWPRQSRLQILAASAGSFSIMISPKK